MTKGLNFGNALDVTEEQNYLTVDVNAANVYTDEDAQDAVGTILSSQFTYDDGGDAINIDPHGNTTDAHHQDPTSGTGITDEGTNQFGIVSGGVTDTELGVDTFSYDPGMTEWATGLTNEEINRIDLQAGETLVIERIEFRQKGGGSSASASIDVRDVTAATTVGSQNLGGTTKDPGSTGTANTIIIRLNNSTGSKINASPRIEGYITGA